MNPPATEKLLRRQYRWMLLAPPLAVFGAGLAATLTVAWFWHPSWARIEQWQRLPLGWGLGVALSALAALVPAALRRRSLAHSAQRLDASLDARNRLETAAALRGDSRPIARIQREETAAFLSQAPVRDRRLSLALLAAAVVLLLLGHLVTLVSWTRPWERPAAAAAPPPSAAPVPKATLTWKSPEAESKATPIEEVPLAAVADSTSGLRDLRLEIEVNGEPRLPTPVPMDALAKKGSHPIDVSIYLDQLEVQPFDVVSYHLRAQRIDPRPLPETVSAVQFVQIKPFREDVGERAGGAGTPSLALILALKVAQLRLIKENFVLAHAEVGKDNPEWRAENTRVGRDQAALEAKTGEVVAKLIADGIPAEIVDLVTQARAPMKSAAEKIAAAQNQPALAPQGRALALITEVEKFVVRTIAKNGSSRNGPKNPEDPFKKQQELELKQRLATKAGELELLAREQARLAGDLAKAGGSEPAPTPAPAGARKDPNHIDGSLAERQTQISQRVGALLNGQIFVPEVVAHLTRGQADARGALRLLDAADPVGAREPAATAARELRLALDEMNRRGEEETRQQLADAMQKLNDAAAEARSAPQQGSAQAAQQKAESAAQSAADTAKQLAEAARRQQETGSADAAKRLEEIVKALNDRDFKTALQRLRENALDPARANAAADRLENLADRAGKAGVPGELSPDQIAALIQQMERTQANMERLARNEVGGGAKPPGGRNGPPAQPGNESAPGSGQGSGSGTGGQPSAAGTGSGGTGSSPGGQAGDAREQFAAQLLREAQQQSQLVEKVIPQASAFHRAVTSAGAQTSALGRFRAAYPILAPPMQEAISLLRAKLQTLQRQHRLTAGDPEQAPAAYRPAVADYFEELSEDYRSTPEAAPTP